MSGDVETTAGPVGLAQIPKADISVDAGGLNCPLPILKARQAMLAMSKGQILKVVASDPASAEDFPAFVEATANLLLASETKGKNFIYYLQIL